MTSIIVVLLVFLAIILTGCIASKGFRKVTFWFLGLGASCIFGPIGITLYVGTTFFVLLDTLLGPKHQPPVEIHHHHQTVVHPVVVVAPVVTSTRPVRHYDDPRPVIEGHVLAGKDRP